MGEKGYSVNARFDNIGDLKVRAPVKFAGVRVGNVSSIYLEPETFKAVVNIRIFSEKTHIPKDSIASILTEGLLGSNYISLTPGFSDKYLNNNGSIEETHSALILEDLVGQLLFNINKKDGAKKE